MNATLGRTPPDRSIPQERRTEIRRFLVEELPGAAQTPAGRRQLPSVPVPARRALTALAIAVVAVAVAVIPGMLPDRGSAFAVRQLPGGLLEVEMSTQFRDGDALAAELREYGVSVDVEAVPASPTMVGQIFVHNQTGGDYIPEGMTISPDGSPNPTMTIDPDVFSERLTIKMYVTPAPGEPYTTSAEVFTPGEALGGLHCALGQPVRAADVVAHLDRLGLDAVWYVVHPTDDRSVTQSEQVDEVPEGTILSGYAIDAATIRFDVRPDGVTLPEPENTPRLSDMPCTPDRADPWK